MNTTTITLDENQTRALYIAMNIALMQIDKQTSRAEQGKGENETLLDYDGRVASGLSEIFLQLEN